MKKLIHLLFLVLGPITSYGQFKNSFEYTRAHLLSPSSDVILVAAHRGMHTNFPENSIAAIQDAIEHHIDIVEIDVRVTRDGVPVIMHDKTIDRTTTGSGTLKKLNYSEISTYRLLDDKGKITAFKVPTLAEVLAVGRNKIFFDIDLKVNNSDLKKVLKVVKDSAATNFVFFYDSEYAKIKKVRRHLPAAITMTKIHNRSNAEVLIKKINPQIIHLGNDEKDRNINFISKIQNIEAKPVFVNALGSSDRLIQKDPANISYFLNKGINIIQSDFPYELLNLLIERQKHQLW